MKTIDDNDFIDTFKAPEEVTVGYYYYNERYRLVDFLASVRKQEGPRLETAEPSSFEEVEPAGDFQVKATRLAGETRNCTRQADTRTQAKVETPGGSEGAGRGEITENTEVEAGPNGEECFFVVLEVTPLVNLILRITRIILKRPPRTYSSSR